MDKQINELLEVLKEYQELGISEQIDWIKMKADFAISLKRLKTPSALYSNCPFCMDEKLILKLLY